MRLKVNRNAQGIEAVLELTLAERKAVRDLDITSFYAGKSVSEYELGVQLPASEEDGVRAAAAGLKRQVDARLGPTTTQVYEIDGTPPPEPPKPISPLYFVGAAVIVVLFIFMAWPRTKAPVAQAQSQAQPQAGQSITSRQPRLRWTPFVVSDSEITWVEGVPKHNLHRCDIEEDANCDYSIDNPNRYDMWCRIGQEVHAWHTGKCVFADALGFRSKTGAPITLLYKDSPVEGVQPTSSSSVQCAPFSDTPTTCMLEPSASGSGFIPRDPSVANDHVTCWSPRRSATHADGTPVYRKIEFIDSNGATQVYDPALSPGTPMTAINFYVTRPTMLSYNTAASCR